MRTGNALRTTSGTQILAASSAAVLAARTSVFRTSTETAVMALSGSAGLVRTDGIGGARQFSSRGCTAAWAAAQPQWTLRGAADRYAPPPSLPASPAPLAAEAPTMSVAEEAKADETKAAEPPEEAAPEPIEAATPSESAKPVKRGVSASPPIASGEASPAPLESGGSVADQAGGEEVGKDNGHKSANEPGSAVKPGKPERVHLTIDSLQNYELIEPIPVVIDPLGDRVFVAETPDLNISITGSSIGGAFLQLKDQISAIYENYRSKKFLDPERKRQLKMLETYIGKPKRAWYLARD